MSLKKKSKIKKCRSVEKAEKVSGKTVRRLREKFNMP